MGASFPDSGSTLRSIHRSHPTLHTSNPILAKHARLDSLVLVTAPVYCAMPCSIVRDRASKAEAVLNDFAISRGSLEARICRKASLASMSGRVRMYSITACSWLTSICKARCFRRNDVKCETLGSMSYTQERPFSTQRWHELRWPLHFAFPLLHRRQAALTCVLFRRSNICSDGFSLCGSGSLVGKGTLRRSGKHGLGAISLGPACCFVIALRFHLDGKDCRF